MNDDQFLLANAYLDGEVTAEERAIAESDAEVMSAVEELRALQSHVRDIDLPTAEVRNRAIDAAMAQFTPSSSTSVASETRRGPQVVPFRPRPSYSRYLGVAAAVVAVGLLGLVVVRGLNSGSDNSAASAPAPAAARPAANSAPATDAPSESPALEAAAAPEAPTPEPEPQPDAMPEAVAADPDAMPEAVAADPDAGVFASDVAADAVSEELLAGFTEFNPLLQSPEDLGLYGSFLREQNEARNIAHIPNTQCELGDTDIDAPILGEADYLFAGIEARIFVAVHVDRAASDQPAVFALDQSSCEIVAESTFP
jgi:hypothetical protein